VRETVGSKNDGTPLHFPDSDTSIFYDAYNLLIFFFFFDMSTQGKGEGDSNL
jgi:hypothetical protein